MKVKNIVFILTLILLFFSNTTVLAENNSTSNNSNKKEIEDGYYILKSALDNNTAIDIDGISKRSEARLQLWENNKGSNQVFQIIFDEKTGTYRIKSALSGKSLDLKGASKNAETAVQLYDSHDQDWQKWIIEKTKNGNYKIKSQYSGLYLEAKGSNPKMGADIEVYYENNGKNQEFIFEKIEEPENINKEKGFYQIVANNNKVMDVYSGSKTENATIGLWDNYTDPNQRFKIIKKENGYYSIINLNSNLYLEADGWQLKQCKEDKNTIAQDWIIANTGENYNYIVSRCGGRYITIEKNNVLTMEQLKKDDSQKFKLYINGSLEGKQILKDGYYTIASSINENRVFDIYDASIQAEAKTILWDKSERNNQKFKFTYDGNGYYTITSVRSKKALDVRGAIKSNCAKLQQYYNSNNDWQKWVVIKNSDGTYSITSVYNGLYVELPNSDTSNGTEIQLYMGNGGNNQKFILEETTAVEGEKTIKDGFYKIKSNVDNGKVIDISDFSKKENTKIGLWYGNNGYNQRFKISYKENGFYSIVAVHSNMALSTYGNTNNVVQKNQNNSEEQEWAIKKGNGNSYYFVSAHNGLVWNTINIENAIKLDNNFEKTKLFNMESVEVETGSRTIEDNGYQIISSINNNRVLDIEKGTNDNGAKVEIWTNNKQNNQKFEVKYQNDGCYKIIAKHSNKALGINQAGDGEKVEVKQYDVSDSIKQEWIIKEAGNGYYYVISACNGLYLSVDDESASNGANIVVSTKNNTKMQKFKFEKLFKLEVTSGTYGSTGLKIKGDSNGSLLKYYKIGTGPNVYFATFAVHGFEDGWNNDGQVLTRIAEDFKNRLIEMQDETLSNKWTIYIFPSVNPDGEYHGWTNNGPGRTSLYSDAPNNKGIDINRCWSAGYTSQTQSNRNYNGTQAFQSYEARALRDFLLNKKSQNGQTILVDLHGWLNETIGDEEIGRFYRSKYGMSKHIYTYGQGYLVNWAKSNLGSNGRTARSSLVELPEYDQDSSKYINATIEMLRNIN